ncbi:vomeronasal type-1 receptor 4-like [Apodemus sylvaticus]|uniref:vomeronasal type-1 receptor 4-like n=1 Tax=Apodemus sylvaticus TaxID=10129 RepID=UPI002241D431|nr:vomeronasal type-1 receptor 4-like [Apodemus sylvaticus]XP_052037215.1 vomeronasal type-1 receptor 4-like [Apodemus sylvaticus]
MKMRSENFAMGIFLFSQITLGMLGNSSILFHYVILIYTGKHLMPKDLIIEHLTFANCLSIISKGIPRTMSDWGFKNFLNDTGCKLIMYISRVTRGVSLYSMCLLSCFQAITVSISNSRWMMLKYRATKYIGPSCSVSWLVHLLLNIFIPARVLGPSYKENATNWVSYGYCSLLASGSVTTVLYMFLLCFSDVLCLSLMAYASVFMVHTLYKHKRQVKYIHTTQHFLKVSPEDRATETILTLLCIFVISYSFSSILAVLRTCTKYPVLWGVNVFTYIELSFPIFCPLVLITNMKSSFILFLPCFGKR